MGSHPPYLVFVEYPNLDSHFPHLDAPLSVSEANRHVLPNVKKNDMRVKLQPSCIG